MSVGAICFTSSSSNGGCWVVLVSPSPRFFDKGFLPHTRLTPNTKVLLEKKRDLRQKKSYLTYAKKKKANYTSFRNRVTLFSLTGASLGGGGLTKGVGGGCPRHPGDTSFK